MLLQTLLFLLLAAGPLQQGPWVYGARENSVNILWVSEKPGMAYVELADGTVKYETFAGRRIFQRLPFLEAEIPAPVERQCKSQNAGKEHQFHSFVSLKFCEGVASRVATTGK